MPAGVIDSVQLIRQWYPLLGFGRRYSATTDGHQRALVVADFVEWLASQTANKLDDKIVKHIVAILHTEPGEALVRDLVAIVDSLPQEPAT